MRAPEAPRAGPAVHAHVPRALGEVHRVARQAEDGHAAHPEARAPHGERVPGHDLDATGRDAPVGLREAARGHGRVLGDESPRALASDNGRLDDGGPHLAAVDPAPRSRLAWELQDEPRGLRPPAVRAYVVDYGSAREPRAARVVVDGDGTLGVDVAGLQVEDCRGRLDPHALEFDLHGAAEDEPLGGAAVEGLLPRAEDDLTGTFHVNLVAGWVACGGRRGECS